MKKTILFLISFLYSTYSFAHNMPLEIKIIKAWDILNVTDEERWSKLKLEDIEVDLYLSFDKRRLNKAFDKETLRVSAKKGNIPVIISCDLLTYEYRADNKIDFEYELEILGCKDQDNQSYGSPQRYLDDNSKEKYIDQIWISTRY